MSRLLVAVGQKLPNEPVLSVVYSFADPEWRDAAEDSALDEMDGGLPDWLWNGGKPVEDDDLYRKQQIEEHIAWGNNDLL